MQYSVDVRNAKLDAVERQVGPGPVLRLITGHIPVNCASADEGMTLATVRLPPDWMLPADDGAKSMKGTWRTQLATEAGIPGYFRIYDAAGRCKVQGSVGMSEAFDMRISQLSLNRGQSFEVEIFTIRDNNG